MTTHHDSERPHSGFLRNLFGGLSETSRNLLVIIAAATVGWGGHVLFSEQADVPNRLTAIELRITNVEQALNALNQVDGISVRLRMTEETLCTPERRVEVGPERDRYCEVINFIRENGLPRPPRIP